MSLYEDMVQAWVDRREWDLGFHDQCKELVTAFFRVFRQQTGAHPIRPLHVDDLSPQAERDYSLVEAMKPIHGAVESGRTVLRGYEVCMGLLLEGPPEESPRQLFAVHLKVASQEPGDRSLVVLSILGSSKEFRLPLVLPAIEVELAPGDKPFPFRPAEETDTGRRQVTWLHACLRNFRRLPPERRSALAREWQALAGKFGIIEGLEPSSVERQPALTPLFSSEEATAGRRSQALSAIQHVLLALGPDQERQNQRALEELSSVVAREIFLVLLTGEDTLSSKDRAREFSFRSFAQPRPPRA